MAKAKAIPGVKPLPKPPTTALQQRQTYPKGKSRPTRKGK